MIPLLSLSDGQSTCVNRGKAKHSVFPHTARQCCQMYSLKSIKILLLNNQRLTLFPIFIGTYVESSQFELNSLATLLRSYVPLFQLSLGNNGKDTASPQFRAWKMGLFFSLFDFLSLLSGAGKKKACLLLRIFISLLTSSSSSSLRKGVSNYAFMPFPLPPPHPLTIRGRGRFLMEGGAKNLQG